MKYIKPVQNIYFGKDKKAFIYAVSRRESSSNLNLADTESPNIESKSKHNRKNLQGYIGYFQFGESALYDLGYFKPPYEFSSKKDSAFQNSFNVNDWIGNWTGKNGVTSKAIFLKDRTEQMKAFNQWINTLCKRLNGLNVNEFYGKKVNGIELTESGAIAGAHLTGPGTVLNFAKGHGSKKDAFGTKVEDYINLFSHYNLENCCNRKIYIQVIDKDNNPIEGKKVTVESDYPEGKYYNDIGKLVNIYETDENGEIPVIVRHPGCKIKIQIDNKSKNIVQQKDKKEKYIIKLQDEVSITAKLEKNNKPQSRPQDSKTPQEIRNENENKVNNDKKDITFNLQIVEADTNKPISNMGFFLTYKGNIKRHQADKDGIKHSITAEEGQDIEVSVTGKDKKIPIFHFKADDALNGAIKQIKLPVVSFKILIYKKVGTGVQVVPNTVFSIFYRGREIKKRTNAQGVFNVKMLAGFVYGFGANGNQFFLSRVDNSVDTFKLTLSEYGVKLAQSPMSTPTKKPSATGSEEKPKTQEKPKVDVPKNEPPKKNNTYTEKNGAPLTTVGDQSPVTSDITRYHIYHDGKIKRENKAATGYAEFIYYAANGAKHNLGKSKFIVAPKRKKGNVEAGGSVYLIDQRKHTSYLNGNVNYKWTIISESKRYYLNGITMAAVLGALIHYGNEEFVGSGFSTIDAKSAGGSTSHINGEAGDFRYLGHNGKHKTEAVWTSYPSFDMAANTRLVKALKKFGFGSLLTGTKAKDGVAKVPGTTYWDDHHHHLHVGRHNYNVEDI